MSDENGQEIGLNVSDEDELVGEEDEEEETAAPPQPVEVVREEIVTVTENPNAETFSEEKVSTIRSTGIMIYTS
jgi:hypothetical protein